MPSHHAPATPSRQVLRDAVQREFHFLHLVPCAPRFAIIQGARVVQAHREKVVLPARALDDLIPRDHFARWLYAAVVRLNLTPFYRSIGSRLGVAGRPAIDPPVLITLWLYFLCDGFGSAQKLEELCKHHDVYRWILGQNTVGAHVLSDFRVAFWKALKAFHESVLSGLDDSDLLDLDLQAQDGTKVRAAAGAASFHRESTTREKLEALSPQKPGEQPQSPSPKALAAQARAAKDLKTRLTQALETFPNVPKPVTKKGEPKREKRVSSTDPEARVMKGGDGGFRPAYNVQLSTTVGNKVIVAFDITSQGSDQRQLIPMLAKLDEAGYQPRKHFVDGGFVTKAGITEAARLGTTIYAPEQKQRKAEANTPKENDSEEVAAWRLRMATEEAKEAYKQRAATAELVNADLKNHGLVIRVRGSRKVRMIVAWAVIAYNLRRRHSLEQRAARLPKAA